MSEQHSGQRNRSTPPSRQGDDTHIRVAVTTHEHMLTSSITLPIEILRAAAQAHRHRPTPTVSAQLLSQTGGTLEPASGVALETTTYTALTPPDILIIPAIWRNPLRVLKTGQWQLDVINACAAAGSRICSVGSGSFLLAQTGLLNHKQATTHWQWFDSFAQRYPAVRLRRDRLITQSGPLFCVGSVNSIADLMVYLSSILFSTRAARAVENQFSPEIRRPFTPYSLFDETEQHTDEPIADAQLLIRGQLREPLTIDSLAARVGLHARTFSRRFKRAVGVTPGQYLTTLRINEAKMLLQHSNLSVGEIGWEVGFRDPSLFSRQFRRAAGVTPKHWRTAVRGKSFNPPEPGAGIR